MEIIYKNRFAFLFILTLSLTFTSCKNNATDNHDGHDHSTAEEGGEEHDEHEESSNFVTLTKEQMNAVNIELGKVEDKELTATIKANGELMVPNNYKANATTLYGGVIQKLNIQEGNYVKKGQVIAEIANPQMLQIQEEFLILDSKIELAKIEVQRQNELNEGNAGALKNLQNARSELNIYQTRRASLQQQIRLMGINPDQLTNSNLKSNLLVKSPLNGVVSNVFAKIGSYVDVSYPVAEIVDNGSLHLDLQIFEKDLPLIKIGQVIHFTLTNNPTQEYDAKVFSIGSSFENDSKTIAIHCTITGDKTGLIDGMNITGIVSLNNITAPAVTNEAIVNDEGKDYIFVVVEDQHEGEDVDHPEGTQEKVNFERIQVLKGISNMGYTLVTFVNDIPANADIVTKGAFFINAKMMNSGGEHAH